MLTSDFFKIQTLWVPWALIVDRQLVLTTQKKVGT